jgi:hypothetical protein
MVKNYSLKIVEEKNVFSDHMLDIIGNEFKFDHAKGLSELLKNSVSAYIRDDIADKDQNIVFRFTDGKSNGTSIECIDFVGMTETDITKAFKIWGDPEAAKRGLNKKVYGGHGNGGKFYMRQMFKESYFITYHSGLVNIFGFSKNKKYGFAQGYTNKKMKPEEALKLAEISNIIFPKNVKEAILSSKTGFTVVKGLSPEGMKNKINVKRIIEKFRTHPQSLKILGKTNVSVIYNGDYLWDFLKADEIKPLLGFETPKIIFIPEILKEGDAVVKLVDSKFSQGKLILRTSEEAFSRGGRLADLNRIDIMGELGTIASYQIFELGVTSFPQAAFIYGECECPILENPEHDCVKNDRTKLVENDITQALTRWIAERIDDYAREISDKEQKEKGELTKNLSSKYNEVLNKWKDKFMSKVFSEIFGDGGGGKEGGGGSGARKHLEYPKDGMNFTFTAAEIPLNQSWPLTLKVATPDRIPVGAIISVESSNLLIEVEDKKIVIKPEMMKLAETGETVAVVNVSVIGQRVGEVGKVIAKAGKYSAQIDISVVEEKIGGGKKNKYPKVLLSGYDLDPLNIVPSGSVILSPRDPVVYQRHQDVKEGIYWINTSAPIAESILKLEQGGAESARWRDYLFQRYVDIFVKEALYELQKKEPDDFRAERVDSDIMGALITKIHAAATIDLEQLLFNESYKPNANNE